MLYVLSGGGSGATLVVTGVAGDTCSITDGTKTRTKTFGTDKKATFKGLATGTWTVTMTNGTKTSTRTIFITADYALTIDYFSATISITYPAKSTCVVKNSSGTQVAIDTNDGTDAKTWTTTVGATGVYTITSNATDGSGKTKTTTVSITADGQSKSVILSYEYIIFADGQLNSEMGALNNRSLSTYKIENNKITCSRTGSNAGNSTGYGSFTLPVDLTSRENLYIRVSSENYPTYTKFGIEAEANTNTFAASQSKTTKESETLTIPVASFSGSRNILIEITGLGDPSFGALTTIAYIEKMWLV